MLPSSPASSTPPPPAGPVTPLTDPSPSPVETGNGQTAVETRSLVRGGGGDTIVSSIPPSFPTFAAQASSSTAIVATQGGNRVTLPITELPFPSAQDNPDCYIPLMKGTTTWVNIPSFAIVTGKNGSGKTQLLDWIRVFIKSPDNTDRVYCIYKKPLPPEANSETWIRDEIYRANALDFYKSGFAYYQTERDKLTRVKENYCVIVRQTIDIVKRGITPSQEQDVRSFLLEGWLSTLLTEYISHKSAVNRQLLKWETLVEKLLKTDFEHQLYSKFDNDPWQHLLAFINECGRVLKEPTLPWQKLNELLHINKQNLQIQGVFGSRGDREQIHFSRKREDGSEFIINMQHLSSGEKLIIDIFGWQYRTTTEGIKIMLLDEPDRHFDPELCKLFMDCLKLISENGVQIIMTTHRTDTLAYAPEGKIFTIERDIEKGTPARIVPTSKLSALFRLTPNLRELTNAHIKVHTESHDDATFYERVYTHLLELSEKLRKTVVDLVEKKEKMRTGEILSRRFQLSFYSLALDKKGSGGGCAIVPPAVQRDIQAFDNLDARSTTKTLIPRKASYPLGLIDADMDLDHNLQIRANSTRIKPAFQSIKSQLFYTKRYSLENYIYDPVFLFSLLNEDEIQYWFTKNASFSYAILSHYAIREVLTRNTSETKIVSKKDLAQFLLETAKLQKKLQARFDSYFRYFIEQFIGTKVINLKGLDRFTQNMSVEDYNKLYGYLKFGQLTHATQSSLDSLSSTKKTKAPAHTGPVNVLVKLAEDLGVTLADYVTDEAKHKAIVDALMQVQPKKIEILSPDGSHIYSIQYPGFYIYARGHDLEKFIQKTFATNKDEDGNHFKQWLINKIATSPEPLTLPMDLVEVIRELNARARVQANAVIKPPRFIKTQAAQLSSPVASSSGL